MAISTLIFPSSRESPSNSPFRTAIVVWDTRTGFVVKNLSRFRGEPFVRIEYSGDGGILIAIQGSQAFSTYDGRNHEQLCTGTLRPTPRHFPGTLWVQGESILFSTGLITHKQLVIGIHKVRQTSAPSVADVESLPVPVRRGELFFSPARFHVSFVTGTEVVILDARSSEVLLQTEESKPLYKPQGCFSSDGHFFACETLAQEICIWENTPTGYVPRDRLRPRSAFRNFTFSPTVTSIMCWDQEAIQLLDPDVRVSSLPHESAPHRQHGDHVVVHSSSGGHTAIARRGQSAVTLFDPRLDAPRRFLDTGMEIQDIKIVGDTILIADTCQLASWRLETGRETITKTVVFDTGVGDVHRLVLSKDCSRIFLVTSGPETQGTSRNLFVRNVKTGSILAESTIEFDVDCIGFFPDGCRVWFVEKHEDVVRDDGPYPYSNWVWEIGKDEGSATSMPERVDEWPAGCPWMPPTEYCVGDGNQWVMDSRSKLPLLWLPPTWRTGKEWDRRWDGNFLTVLGDRPEPVIIELPSPSLPLHSHSPHLSDS